MKIIKLSLSAPFCAILALTSCGDDPELVKKRQEQKMEIARLEGENNLLAEQLKSLPADRRVELTEIKAKVELQAQELEKLEQEVVQLEAKKRTVEAEFEQYKKTYPISQ